jgi:uncharacterized protein (TIGR03118 family)
MRRSILAGPALAVLFVALCLGTAQAQGYVEKDLVVGGPHADQATKTLKDTNGITHRANFFDENLVNAWGVAESPSSPFWIADNGSGLATLYVVNTVTQTPSQQGQALGLVVSIPPPGDTSATSGSPTGAVFNNTSTLPKAQQEFFISGVEKDCKTPISRPAIFLFATEDGTIVGWNPNVFATGCTSNPMVTTSPFGIIALNHSAKGKGAVYKGLAIATDGNGATFLYAANFRDGRVEKYNGTFGLVDMFTDKTVPDGYAPFNVVLINGELFVTFAVQLQPEKHDDQAGPGNGIVDTFNLSGKMLQRFAEHGALNSPWGVALTPPNFGELGGKLWIGNFGDGHINAYDPGSGKFIGKVRDPDGAPIVIDGLWTIRFGNDGNGGSSKTLYFTAGPNGETDGLFGSLAPSGQNSQGNQNNQGNQQH